MRVQMGIAKDPKTGKYYFREPIPTRLIPAYCELTGKNSKRPEYKCRFNTTSKKEAEALGFAEQVKFDQLIAQLKLHSTLSPRELWKMQLSLFVGGLVKGKKQVDLRLVQELKANVESELKEYQRKAKDLGMEAMVKPTYKAVGMDSEIEVGEYCRHLQIATRILFVYERVLKGEQGLIPFAEIERTQKLLREGQLAYGDHFLASMKVGAKSSPAPKSADSTAPTLSRALELWKGKNNKAESKTLHEWNLAVRRFNEMVGEDLPVDQITEQQMVQFREALQMLPARLPHKYRKMPLPDLIKEVKAGMFAHKDKITSATIRKQFVAVSSIFTTMMDDGYVKTNPASRKAPKKEDSNIRAYRPEELDNLFHSSMYKKPFSKRGGEIEPICFWLPLIALYTGARAKEIRQLCVTDIIKHDKGWFFSLNTYGRMGKSIKTKGSKRETPIHAELIKFGFLDYYDKIKTSGEVRLFTGRNDFSAWYGKYCDGISINDPEVNFQSFRHSFKQGCRESGIPEEIHDKFTGHVNQSVGRGYGDISLKKLNDYMQLVQYDGLDLQHLYLDAYRTRKPLRILPPPKKVTHD